MSLKEIIEKVTYSLGIQQSPPYNWYLMSQRKEVTFKKLYENHSLSYDQVLRLKEAQAIYEVVPLFTFAPMGYIMLGKCLNATSAKAIRGAILWGIPLYTVSSVTARETRDRLYWPIVQEVYKEIIEKQKERERMQSQMMQMILNPKVQAVNENQKEPKENTIKDGKDKKEIKEGDQVEKSPEEILEEKNKVDPFRVKVRKTYDFIKLKYF